MNLTKIDHCELINAKGDNNIVTQLLAASGLTWNDLAINEDNNNTFFTSLITSHPEENLEREVILTKSVIPKYLNKHEACDFFVIEINLRKLNMDKLNGHFHILKGVYANHRPTEVEKILGSPSTPYEPHSAFHQEHSNYDLNIIFEDDIDNVILTSRTPECLTIIKRSNKENEYTEKTKSKDALNTTKTPPKNTYEPTITKPKEQTTLYSIIAILIVVFAIFIHSYYI